MAQLKGADAVILVGGEAVRATAFRIGRPEKKSNPRRVPRAWTKWGNRARRLLRRELVHAAGCHHRWPQFGECAVRQIVAELAESGVKVPRSLRRFPVSDRVATFRRGLWGGLALFFALVALGEVLRG